MMGIGGGIPGRSRLASQDGTSLLLVAPGAITISDLRPYSGWEIFSRRIGEALTAFAELIDTGFSIERIGLRYINHVLAPSPNLSEYFNVEPLSFRDAPVTLKSFISRSEQIYNDDPRRLIIATFGTIPAEYGSGAVVLDLDVIGQDLEGIESVDSAIALAEEMHRIEKLIFESAITDKARDEVFGGFEEDTNV
jgi:uncharacterized protein (TIGR04255 family)